MTGLARVSAPSRPAGVLAASGVFAGRSLRHSRRDVESLLMAVILPVMLMLVFTFVFGGAMEQASVGGRDGYLGYVVPGIILTCAGFGAATTAVSVSLDMTTGMMARLRSMPIPSATVLVGHAVASLARNLLATAVVVAVALLVGYRPDADLLGWVGAGAVIALWILAVTSVFAVIGLVAHSPEAASGYGFLLLFLPYVSSAFAPVETMPGWLQDFATHQPVTPVVETIRAFLSGGAPGAEAAVAVSWCAGITVAAVVVGRWVFTRTRG